MGAARRSRLVSVAAAKSARDAAVATCATTAARFAASAHRAAAESAAAESAAAHRAAAGGAALLPRRCRCAKHLAWPVRLHVLAAAR